MYQTRKSATKQRARSSLTFKFATVVNNKREPTDKAIIRTQTSRPNFCTTALDMGRRATMQIKWTLWWTPMENRVTSKLPLFGSPTTTLSTTSKRKSETRPRGLPPSRATHPSTITTATISLLATTITTKGTAWWTHSIRRTTKSNHSSNRTKGMTSSSEPVTISKLVLTISGKVSELMDSADWGITRVSLLSTIASSPPCTEWWTVRANATIWRTKRRKRKWLRKTSVTTVRAL